MSNFRWSFGTMMKALMNIRTAAMAIRIADHKTGGKYSKITFDAGKFNPKRI
jgi:hypothetical protein